MLSLLFGVHAHQPAGNFPEVLEHAHERCYRPFLQILHRYPEFRFAVHFSGPLLDDLFDRHPRDMELLVEMVERGQVELFGAGDTEPVLASIPDRDRRGQVEKLSRKLEWRFGRRPKGAWLTERVWEATVVPALAQSGIAYVTVDDYHFLCTGKRADALDGYFTTEEGGHRLDLFPISEQLRYRFPFSPAADAVTYLQQLADGGALSAIYFDDIEKFGIWPETYEWVYERGWLQQFIERTLACEAVRTSTYDEYHATHRTNGIVYLPTTSYIEMNEWTLPAEAAGEFAALVTREKQAATYEAHKPYIRGGIWKNFMTRYPEANWMHKRMTALSARLDAARPRLDDRERSDLETQLYLGQANDAYWHGLFGGVYMPHLRRGIYKSLVRLEAELDRHAPRPPVEVMDIDFDGVDEMVLHTTRLQAIVKLDGLASVCELDSYELGQNFGDTLRRSREHYHARALEKKRSGAAGKSGDGIASAHDRFHVKQRIEAADIEPDRRGRGIFVDSWLGPAGPRLIDGYSVRYALSKIDTALPNSPVFTAESGDVAVEKRLAVRDGSVVVDYLVEAASPVLFQVELDLAMPCCDGYAGRYMHEGEVLGGFGQPLAIGATEAFALDDRYLGGTILIAANREVTVKGEPYFTVSQSEDGLEKVMQSVTVTLTWPVPAGVQETQLVVAVRATPDVTNRGQIPL